MPVSHFSSGQQSGDDILPLKAVRLRYDTPLLSVLPESLALPLKAYDIVTAEDLYECVAAVGPGWFKNVPGIDQKRACALLTWLYENGEDVGEVTARFFMPGHAPEALLKKEPEPLSAGIVPLERLRLSDALSGREAVNRAPAFACSLDASDDLDAIRIWLNARASNPNTEANYRKEAERFLLWCLVERETALSSVKAGDAALYLRWIEGLGRTDEKAWAQKWKTPQSLWICPKNTPRDSAAWRPFNGPLGPTSRKNAIVVVRQLYNFLKKTGYLIFNPFDQVSPKVPLLRGEGAPQAYADRSLTDAQWEDIVGHLDLLDEGWPRERMKLILMMGKSLGMRASEMIEARADWVVERRVGFKMRRAIEILGKGAKVRRLPLNGEQVRIIDGAFRARGFAGLQAASPETPFLVNLGRGRHPHAPLTRTGLYVVLKTFFDRVALEVSQTRPMDAAKLTASSTHWLRHTFAVNALSEMSVNVVQAAMGHASVATTGRYLSPEEETMSEAMEKMKAL